MIVNFLRFRFRDDVTAADRDRALAAIHRTAASEAVAFAVIGQDLGDPADGYTHAYCVGIRDLAALERYMAQPAHREGDFLFLPLLAKLARSAASDDLDPGARDRIGAIAGRYLAGDAAWAALFAGIPDLRLG